MGVIKYVLANKRGFLLGYDSSSGGYPYTVDDITHAKLWPDRESAVAYADVFLRGKREDPRPDWEPAFLFKVVFDLRDCQPLTPSSPRS